MKKVNFKNHLTPIILLASLTCSTGFAQDDLLEDTESVLNSDQIDIDGAYKQKPRQSAADRLEKVRQQLEERNEQMVQKKIEDIRFREEQKLTNKLKNAFQAGMDNMDSVSTGQSAPQRQQVVAPAPAPKAERNTNKITPKLGVTAINNNENIDFESNTNFGIEIESEISPRISFGLSFNYMTVDFEDRTQDINNYSIYYNQDQGVELTHQNLNISAYTKFFLATEAKIRPFVGLGVGYNRARTEYTSDVNNNTYDPYNYYNNFNQDVESTQTTYLSGSIFGGAEISFNETIGAAIEVKYDKSMNEQDETMSNTFNSNYYEQRLEQLNSQINNSDNVSLSAGLQVRF